MFYKMIRKFATQPANKTRNIAIKFRYGYNKSAAGSAASAANAAKGKKHYKYTAASLEPFTIDLIEEGWKDEKRKLLPPEQVDAINYGGKDTPWHSVKK